MANPFSIQSALTVTLQLFDTDGSPVSTSIPVDVTGMQITYALNTLPHASFTVPTGVGMTGSRKLKLAAIHELLKKGFDNYYVRATLKAYGRGYITKGGLFNWPSDEIELWYGRINGFGYVSQTNRQSYMINSVHWLEKLASSTVALSGVLRGSIDYYDKIATDNTTGYAGPNTPDKLKQLITRSGGQYRLWSTVLRKVINAFISPEESSNISAKGAFWYSFINRIGDCGGIAVEDKDIIKFANQEAYDILNQSGDYTIHNSSELPMPGEDLLNLGTIHQYLAEEMFLTSIANLMSNNVGSASIWDKLIAVGQVFNYNVAPTTRSFALIPGNTVFPASKVWRTLTRDDITGSQGTINTPASLAGVALVGTRFGSFSGVDQQGDDPRGDAIGAFIAREYGQVHIEQAPQWLGSIFATSPSKEAAAEFSSSVSEIESSKDQLACKWAQAIWLDEAFKSRQTTITTPFRLDIAPGSCIGLDNAVDFVDASGSTIDKLYGYVNAVTLTVDANSKVAQTSLKITHLRGDEHENEDIVPDQHPLYGDIYSGLPLTKVTDKDLS